MPTHEYHMQKKNVDLVIPSVKSTAFTHDEANNKILSAVLIYHF